MPHRHAERFDFALARHTAVHACERVVEGAPVLFARRDSDGDWQFLCGNQHAEAGDGDGVVLACLECVVAQDPSLNELADLCIKHSASRETASAKWKEHDDHEDFIHEAIATHGWAVQGIPAGDGKDEPAFTYTVGLHKSYGHAELICFGLPLDTLQEVVNDCGTRVKNGEALPLGQPIADVLEDYPVMLRAVRDRKSYQDHIGYALWYYGGHDFPLYQLVWPDKDGRFPGDANVAEFVSARQPLLP